jgi:hypothetical protein
MVRAIDKGKKGREGWRERRADGESLSTILDPGSTITS